MDYVTIINELMGIFRLSERQRSLFLWNGMQKALLKCPISYLSKQQKGGMCIGQYC